jgi:hypothetical protein
MTDGISIALSLAIVAAFAIGGGGLYILLKRPAERRRGLLMVLVAAITIANVWLLTAPIP